MRRFFLIFLLLISIQILPQNRLSLQAAAALPTGYAEDAVSVGYGGSINYGLNVLYQHLELSATAGYYYFGLKENLPDYDFSFKSLPLLIGLRWNFTDYDFIPYAGIETGVYLTEYFLEIDYGIIGKTSEYTRDIHWGFSPMLGFRMNLSPMFDIDVNAKYNNIRTRYIARAYLLIQTGFSLRF